MSTLSIEHLFGENYNIVLFVKDAHDLNGQAECQLIGNGGLRNSKAVQCLTAACLSAMGAQVPLQELLKQTLLKSKRPEKVKLDSIFIHINPLVMQRTQFPLQE
jgi:hypothetical protein